MNPKLELACTLSWFNNWSPNQKEEFGKLVVELNRPFGELAATTQTRDLAVEDLGEMAALENTPRCRRCTERATTPAYLVFKDVTFSVHKQS